MHAIVDRFVQVLRDGVSMFWLAPIIVALIIIPEFIQHIAEIRLGMFDNREAFRAMADDPRRMVWGILKIAGLVLAILATIRFWGTRDRGRRWWDVRGMAWTNFVVALVLIILVGLPGALLEPIIGPGGSFYLGLLISIATLPLLVLLVAGLIGDETAGLKSVFRNGWLASICMIAFAAIVWLPLQWLHGANHDWALGASNVVIWALMIFDALVVGLMATLAGTAFHHGYELQRAGKL